MKSQVILLSFVYLFILSSCVDQIPVTIEENKNEYLIVNAQLSNATSVHLITLKLNAQASTDFQADFPVDDATVVVIENGNTAYPFLNAEKGEYRNSALSLQVGSSYELQIIYRDITYKSTVEYMLPPIPITELNSLLTTETVNNAAGNIISLNFVNLFLNTQLPKEENAYVKYRIKGQYTYNENGSQGNLNPKICYIKETIDLDNIVVVDGSEIFGGNLNDQLVLTKVSDYRFSQNYCMTVYQERISREAFDFWNLVQNEYSRTGDIFENPPGILRGNIAEIEQSNVSSIGLFSVSSIDSMQLKITPTMAGNPRNECSVRPSNRPARCENCLSIIGSSLIRPDCL